MGGDQERRGRPARASASVGIDVGGTFTDAVLADGGGRLHMAKVPTTPGDLASGFLDALTAVLGAGPITPAALTYLVHGSTVAANAIVQGTTARVGLLTTAGFRDVLEIGTQQRPALYDLRAPKPAPLVPRELRLEARERIGPAGQVLEPLAIEDVEAAARTFAAAGVEAAAISFLFSFVNPEHEEAAERILRRSLPNVPVSVSSRVAPELREYPRTATTALNASLLPLAGRYVEQVANRLAQAGTQIPLHVLRSNGGVARAEMAAELPVGLLASGPAAGVIGAARLSALSGSRDLLTFDMGGTTADVGLVVGGEPQLRFRGEVAGHPISLPQIDVLSVGSGGGSIAHVDAFGSLLVGPQSAGADPGPAAYGRGGEQATVTDAYVVLQMLDTARFLGGRVNLDVAAARRSIAARIARPLTLSALEAAAAVLRVANATMARALRLVSVARGQDPRRFALVAFGGAGPLHACAIADELGIERVLVPRYPGVTSAHGLLLADVRHDLRRSFVRPTRRVRPRELDRQVSALEQEARELLARSGFPDGRGRIDVSLDIRYRGQAYELTVPLPERGVTAGALRAAEQAFHAAHRRTYGHDLPVEETEIVTVRVQARGPARPRGGNESGRGRRRVARPLAARDIRTLGGGRERYALFERDDLGPGSVVRGPAVIGQDDATLLVASGWTLVVAEAGNAILQRARQ